MLYTIGHSTQTLQDLVRRLVKYDINCVYDVRSIPFSKYNPQFNKPVLEKEVRSVVMDYKWRKDLGGLDDNIPDDVYNRALSELIEESERHNVVVLCSEGDYKKCHRWSKIAESVVKMGKPVYHILMDSEVFKQEGFQEGLF